ncbi:hypothetical protein MYB_00360 [Mesomycoplasma bovoculi M165/69]|uniref:Uncharacterized protein n=2 Tax=Mesomycoplasma bovoculi TaxID=45362 RepID=W5UZW7_9BACT|nr:hypothetical protein MYB_00360 [Mesomycoplasma bovoculi M165/69]
MNIDSFKLEGSPMWEAIKKLPFSVKKKIFSGVFQVLEISQQHNERARVFKALNITDKSLVEGLSPIEHILSILDPKYSTLLIKEFLEEDKAWIKKYWSKSTYYKNIHKAMDEFLYYLYF